MKKLNLAIALVLLTVTASMSQTTAKVQHLYQGGDWAPVNDTCDVVFITRQTPPGPLVLPVSPNDENRILEIINESGGFLGFSEKVFTASGEIKGLSNSSSTFQPLVESGSIRIVRIGGKWRKL